MIFDFAHMTRRSAQLCIHRLCVRQAYSIELRPTKRQDMIFWRVQGGVAAFIVFVAFGVHVDEKTEQKMILRASAGLRHAG